MSAEIASLERVRQAVETIRRRNGVPTADRVIEVIGGGSKKTVLSHLRTLRDPQVEEDGIPAAVTEIARGALAEIYRAGAQAEADRSRALMDRLAVTLQEQEAQIAELAEENSRYLHVIPELTRQRDEARLERSRAEEKLADALATKQTLESDLSKERLKRSEGLDKAIARIEGMVSSRTATRRPTVSLPDKPRHARTRSGSE